MGLKSAFERLAGAAVGAFGDVAASTTYKFFASAALDASSGTWSTTYSTTLVGVKAIFDVFRIEQVDGENIKSSDRRVLIAARALSSRVPRLNDQVVQGSSTWNVHAIRSDPAQALYDLHVRKS